MRPPTQNRERDLSLTSLLPVLREFKEYLSSPTLSLETFSDYLTTYNLESFFHQYPPFHTFSPDEQSHIIDFFSTVASPLKKQYAKFICQREYGYAVEILGQEQVDRHDLRRVFLDTDIDSLAKDAGLTKDDHVLFIGSGPLPATAILYALDAGCRVDCIEQNSEYADISRQTIKKFKVDALITVSVGNGDAADVRQHNYSVIILALLAEPKDRILEHLAREANPGTRIICRTTTGVESLLYGHTDPVVLDRFDIVHTEPTEDPHYHIFHMYPKTHRMP